MKHIDKFNFPKINLTAYTQTIYLKNIGLIKFVLFCFMFIGLEACNDQNSTSTYQPGFATDTSANKTLVWGFPSYMYCESAEPMIKYLNKRLTGIRIVAKSCVSYEEYLDDIRNNKFDMTVASGFVALEKESNNYLIVGKVKDDTEYSAAIFIRKDAGIKKVSDLKGKKVALVPNKTIGGTLMAKYYLYQNGLDVNHDIISVNAASFESAIINTYIGKSEAGLSLTRNWNVYLRDHPEVLSKLELKWETDPLTNNALMLKNNTDKDVSSKLMSLLFSMHTTDEGKTALNKIGIGGFEKANRDTYKPVLDFKKKYDAVIL